jgi:hypothetical protein
MPNKTYSGYLIVDWRDDEVRFRKTRPDAASRGPTEYPVEVTVEVDVPEFDPPEIATSMSVPEPQVREHVAEELHGGGATPPWAHTVDRAVEHFGDEAAGLDPTETAFDDLVSKATGYVLRRAEGYPPVGEVADELETVLTNIATQQEPSDEGSTA